MHEYALVQALIDRVEAEARAQGAVAVHRVTVRIGDLAGVERDLLKTAYDMFRERTLCAQAELEIKAVPARWVCSGCAAELPAGQVLRCQTCGRPAQLAGGDEILLERLELEVPDV